MREEDMILIEEEYMDFTIGIMRKDGGFLYVFTKEPRRPGTPGVRKSMRILPHGTNIVAEVTKAKKDIDKEVHRRLRIVVDYIEYEREKA